jgi:hypothetical protein
MQPGQRVQRPIRIGQHMNPAVLGDKDGHFRTRLAVGGRGGGGIQQGLGVLGESAHTLLIGMA